MPDVSTVLTAAISSVIAAVIGFLASRRLYGATVREKDAQTAKVALSIADDAVRQLKEVRSEIPGWMEKLAAETAPGDAAAKERDVYKGQNQTMREQAAIIVGEISLLSYWKDPDEEESPVERKFKNIKVAAAKIAALKE